MLKGLTKNSEKTFSHYLEFATKPSNFNGKKMPLKIQILNLSNVK